MNKTASLLTATLMLGACVAQTPEPALGAANPASEYCVAQGGRLEIRQDDQGNEYGVCQLPDGREVDEWEFYRATHGGQ